MPQYGVLVYLPAPADPTTLSAQYLEAIAEYPDKTQTLKAKVLGASYFAAQKGFAFESAESGTALRSDGTRSGTLAESDLVPAAFFVLSAPNQDAATEAAKLHPAMVHGAIEVRPLVPPPPRS